MNEILIVIAGLLLRIAIPAILTICLVVLLRRLDAHWQTQARRDFGKTRKSSARTKDCPYGMTAQQTQLSNELCWQIQRVPGGQIAEKCLECEVFQAAPILSQS